MSSLITNRRNKKEFNKKTTTLKFSFKKKKKPTLKFNVQNNGINGPIHLPIKMGWGDIDYLNYPDYFDLKLQGH